MLIYFTHALLLNFWNGLLRVQGYTGSNVANTTTGYKDDNSCKNYGFSSVIRHLPGHVIIYGIVHIYRICLSRIEKL